MRVPVRRGRWLLGAAALVAGATLAPAQAVGTAPDAVVRIAAPGAGDDCGPTIRKAGGTPWRCTFVDRFNGSGLDPDRWITQETGETGFRSGRTCFTSSRDNIRVHDGALHLTARKGPWQRCSARLRGFSTRYTGGMVGTKGRFSQTYGRFEVRAKYPSNRVIGIHGGFWMYPVEHTYGRWPSSGEIDVAEWWSYEPDRVIPSLHYDGRDPDVDSGWECWTDVTDFHTYTVEWRPTVIRFFIDGTECFARSWTPEPPLVAPKPFDHPFSMILNMGVGPNVSWKADFPATYVVDYAKAWR
ncbi:glycoside hydrolase family 16 protein [Nocardioides stalactiti]|uniref:glycoside hydrolase family 16 protein n=1 Tax=Nocardioides stalactiti TaxID=2755356 RepID=UPI0015FF4921|nr:glycoside hydrolase family 16 protein [Nocardioides stalactiti]